MCFKSVAADDHVRNKPWLTRLPLFAFLKMSVWSGSCSSLTCVAGSDDSCSLKSSVTFASSSGTDYYVFVHGYGGDSGAFELTVASATSPPTLAPTPAPQSTGSCFRYAFFASEIVLATPLPYRVPFQRDTSIDVLQRYIVDNGINDTWVYVSTNSVPSTDLWERSFSPVGWEVVLVIWNWLHNHSFIVREYFL